MRFKKIWQGSWWQLGQLCEVPRCLLWRDWSIVVLCTIFLVYCIFFNKCLFFILHVWIPSGQTSHIISFHPHILYEADTIIIHISDEVTQDKDGVICVEYTACRSDWPEPAALPFIQSKIHWLEDVPSLHVPPRGGNPVSMWECIIEYACIHSTSPSLSLQMHLQGPVAAEPQSMSPPLLRIRRARTLSGGHQTHHSFTESDELHVVGCEDGLLVALDEGWLLSDQPQPILHRTRTPIYCMALGTWLWGGDRRRGATLTASMTMGIALAFDASKMPCGKRKLCWATRPSPLRGVKRKTNSPLINFNISLSTNR